ncbi:MAG TPA: DUF2752 domain-containing protein [Lacibacter sp.]|nr:DUF2752 domain-containing protein [Lacibacter sp.]HMO89090.1 DUF2752 domain-containing protein [Lacibacter sp.]HMP87259.1 DUF2752 domain-containing protein [Lacibacter sp.]
MQAKRLYLLLALLLAGGYAWLIWHLQHPAAGATVCLLKSVSGLPCPSCGTTRGISELLHGNFSGALHSNPFAVPVLLLMGVLPVWLLTDVLRRQYSFFRFYQRTERLIRTKPAAIFLMLLVGGNWIWNIWKQL